MRKFVLLVPALAVLLSAVPAQASLTTFATFTGTVGLSTAGCGSTTQTCTLEAHVPVGATILGAYLYQAYYKFGGSYLQGGTLDGTAVTFGAPVVNPTACCGIAAARADVTSILTAATNVAGTITMTMVEPGGETTSNGVDGEALVVVYSDASLPTATVGIQDGSASVAGDTTSIVFASPLHPGDAGFFAEMRLGDGFSCCSQRSTVSVNGTTITENAGNNDDSADVSLSNGNLITVGDDDDPFSAMLPSYAGDHERYNLVPQIADGDTVITVRTANASFDDNIFLAAFFVSGIASVHSGVPEPTSVLLLGTLVAGYVVVRRRRSRA